MVGVDDARVSRVFLAITVLGIVALVALLVTIRFGHARDLGQWTDEVTTPEMREWFKGLMRPDAPQASCCGEADAYWADEVHVRDGRTFATITDDRPDEPRGRPHIAVGTEVEIPDNKLKWDRSNPTGHGIVFLSREHFVFCFVQPTGI